MKKNLKGILLVLILALIASLTIGMFKNYFQEVLTIQIVIYVTYSFGIFIDITMVAEKRKYINIRKVLSDISVIVMLGIYWYSNGFKEGLLFFCFYSVIATIGRIAFPDKPLKL